MKKRGQFISIFILVFICSGVFVFGAMARETTIVELTHKSTPNSIPNGYFDEEGFTGGNANNFDIYALIKEKEGEEESKGDVSTTFAQYGYYSFLKVDEDEKYVSFDPMNEDIDITEQNTLNDVGIDITAKDDEASQTKVVVTYRAKNNSDEPKNISISSATDVEVGDNDAAAILRKIDKQGFKVTQDNESRFGFGASFEILLQPTAATTWIGFYGESVRERHSDSVIDEITLVDHIDSGLSYSWDYLLEPGETKEFTATFIVRIEESVEIDFYHLLENESGYESEPEKKYALTGGALLTPITRLSEDPGYNYKWSEKEDGSGRTITGDTYIVYEGNTDKYYENKYQNGVVVKKENGNNDPLKTEIVSINKEELQKIAEKAYSDVQINTKWNSMGGEPDYMSSVEEALREKELISDTEKPQSSQMLNVTWSAYVKCEEESEYPCDYPYGDYGEATGYYDEDLIISYEVPEEMREEYYSFRIIKVDYEYPEEDEVIPIYKSIESTYDPITGRILFTAKNDGVYVLIGDNGAFTPIIEAEDIIEAIVGQTADAEVALKDLNGYPLTNVKLQYEIDGKILETTTNEEGKAVIEIESDKEGEIVVKITTEESKFLISTEKEITFVFKKPEQKPACETNPEMEGCKEPEPTCETNPEMEGCKEENESLPDVPETGQNSESDDSIKQAVLITVIISSISALFIMIKRTINDKKSPYKTVK